jgi:DNA ligase D-like protein (predicted 3'-phosphoesterase)
MSKKETLSEYRKKRDFRRTPEPSVRRKKSGKLPRKEPIFVIQKHDARNLHYDFRIEVNGVLKSWAVPKGPSLDPKVKRLSIETEDHPLDYADFEGTIPEGEYGGGTVMVWDKGTYHNLKEKDGREVPMEKCIENGHLTIRLSGNKLRGGYSLTRFRKEENRQWLLVKMDDEEADARRNPVSSEPDSVLTGRTLEEIAEEGKNH